MIIARYLYREIALTLLAILLIAVLVFLSTEFARYLAKVAEGELSIQVLLDLFLSTIPILIGMLLPMAFFIALLLGYTRLYAEHEMTVLFASGFSRLQLLVYTMILAIFIALLTAWLSFEVIPGLNAYQARLLSHTASHDLFATIQPGQFQEVMGGKMVFYVENISRNRRQFQSIFVAQRPEKSNKWKVTMADNAQQHYDNEKKGNFLIANGVNRYEGQAGEKNFQVSHYQQLQARLPSARESQLKTGDVTTLPTSLLLLTAPQSKPAAIELHWRLAIPLQTLILALLGVVLSRLNPRQGRYTPLFIGIIIYIVYANGLFVARGWLDDGYLPLKWGFWWLHGLLLLLALYLFADKPGIAWLAKQFGKLRRAS